MGWECRIITKKGGPSRSQKPSGKFLADFWIFGVYLIMISLGLIIRPFRLWLCGGGKVTRVVEKKEEFEAFGRPPWSEMEVGGRE